jgi:hypothetical protein
VRGLPAPKLLSTAKATAVPPRSPIDAQPLKRSRTLPPAKATGAVPCGAPQPTSPIKEPIVADDTWHPPLPETRCSSTQLWAEIAVVRHSPEFEAAVYNRVADEPVENIFTGYCKPRGGVTIQIARAFQALCESSHSACSAQAIIAYAAERHPLQILSADDRASFGDFFTYLFGDAKDVELAAEKRGIEPLNTGSSCQLANLDALFFTPSGYSYLLANKKAYNFRDHVADIGHLIVYPDGNSLWSEPTGEAASGSGDQQQWR